MSDSRVDEGTHRMSKIINVEVIPLLVPRQDAPPGDDVMLPNVPVVVVRIRTDDGLAGIGCTLAINPDLIFFRTIKVAVEEIAERLIGHDPMEPEPLLASILFPSFPTQWAGPGGVINIAAAALDIALWDIVGKASNQPLWRLFGGEDNRVDIYCSSLFSQDLEVLQQEASLALDRGFLAMKMRAGPADLGVDELVARVAAVRDVIGHDTKLMYDVNQRWSPTFAIQMARELEPFELSWIEEPVSMHDVAGQARVAASTNTPVCSGESYYDVMAMQRLLGARAVSVLMVDVMRLAGYSQARTVFALADAAAIPVCTHLVPEIDAHLVASAKNGLIVEGLPWIAPIFQEIHDFHDGQLHLSEKPGLGLALDEDVLRARRAP